MNEGIGADMIVVWVCMAGMALWAWLTVGPSCPDSEKEPEKAPEVEGRAMAGLFGVGLFLAIIFWAVFTL